jgi:hypothetical protein
LIINIVSYALFLAYVVVVIIFVIGEIERAKNKKRNKGE